MKSDNREEKQDIVEIDDMEFDLEFDEAFSNFLESASKSRVSNNKLMRRRHTKRRLDLLKEKRWFRQNCWFNDDWIHEFEEADA